MAEKPPNYRESICCWHCAYIKITHSCGCCPTECVCSLHDDYFVDEGMNGMCDDFQPEDG